MLELRALSFGADFLAAMMRPANDTIGFYDTIAKRYDAIHRGWMARGGRLAVGAVKGCVAGAANSGASVLNAGS